RRQSAPRKSMPVVYLAFSRGEVAERLKAAVGKPVLGLLKFYGGFESLPPRHSLALRAPSGGSEVLGINRRSFAASTVRIPPSPACNVSPIIVRCPHLRCAVIP